MPDSSVVGATQPRKILRIRQAPYLSDENRRIVYHKLQLDMQTGIGLVEGIPVDLERLLAEDGSLLLAEDGGALLLESSGDSEYGRDPIVYLSWSDDQGRTWSDPYPESAGVLGAYKTRVIWRRLGQARSRIFRVLMSDPVDWTLIDSFLDLTPGSGR